MDDRQVHLKRIDGTDVMVLAGELDVSTAATLKHRVGDRVERGSRRIVIDLREATFIDSATIGVLVGVATRLEAVGGTVAVVCGDPEILETFRIAALDQIVPIAPSADEALAYVRAGAEPAAGLGRRRGDER